MSKAKKTFSIYEDAYQDCIEVVKSKFHEIAKSKLDETRFVVDSPFDSAEEQAKRNKKELQHKARYIGQFLNVFKELMVECEDELFIKFGEYLKKQSVGGK